MKKDIEIPEVKDVFLAAVLQKNENFNTLDWNIFLINNGEEPLETILIVSRGYDEKDTTSSMRHSLDLLPTKSFAKIEFLEDKLLKLNNEFSVSWFSNRKMFHKNFIFGKNSINRNAGHEIAVMNEKGVLAK